MEVTFDQAKREATLKHRGLDFADAPKVFAGLTATVQDDRKNYGEDRFITAGILEGRLVVLVWTLREGVRRIISMRHAHASEEQQWRARMG